MTQATKTFKTVHKFNITPTDTETKKLFIKVVIGFVFVFFIAFSCLRSIGALLTYPSSLHTTLASLHISPQFSPFSKSGDYDNIQSKVRVYRYRDGAGYELFEYTHVAQELGGGHSNKVVVYSTTTELPRQIFRGKEKAAFSVVRTLYCTEINIRTIKINIFNRHTGALTHTYEIPC